MPNRITPRGQNIPTWLKNRTRQIQLRMRDDHPKGRMPSTPQVRMKLAEYLHDREMANATELYPLPSLSAVYKMLKKTKVPTLDPLDSPWSLGQSGPNQLPDEASGALLKMWYWAITSIPPQPFTIRIARWVCKLRWVPEAGGSPHGEVIEPDLLYYRAVQYSGREHKAEMIKGEKSMRSEILDAQLMFSLPAMRLARRIGVLEEDDGIDYGDVITATPEHSSPGWEQLTPAEREAQQLTDDL